MSNIKIIKLKISDDEFNRRFYYVRQALPSLKNNVKSIAHLADFNLRWIWQKD